mmetsp:Transcript_72800/g.168742  ORF Transcript_72800/g.168742 Transcript_72800/m.168742 type:complete len:374 (-) Transcript_72800:163-1284(-)
MLSTQFNSPCSLATAGPAAGATLRGSLPSRFERPHRAPPLADTIGSVETFATIAGVLATVSLGVAARESQLRRRKTRLGQAKHGIEVRLFKEMAPKDLYELLRIPSSATPLTIKQAYYKMQKICHPDVAGPEGEEMCVLLNDAYDVLSNPQTRAAYDMEIGKTEDKVQEVSADLSPTWAWRPKEHGKRPSWRGEPRSRSKWARVPPEERGPNHAAQKFVFVDEWSCISCRNCCDVSPKTFCIDAEHGRARVYTQWGESEEYLDYAVSSCPVDCIYWVSREELQVLEHVTADKMYDGIGGLPCPMAVMQGMHSGHVDDPFELAATFKRQREKEKEMKTKSGQLRALQAASDKFKNRIEEVFRQLSEALRVAGWG